MNTPRRSGQRASNRPLTARPGPAVAPARRRLAVAVLSAALVIATILGGAGTRGHETEARWSAAKGADGTFTAMTLGSVQNYRCTGGFWSSATVSWQRPAAAPSGTLSYLVTFERAGTTKTTMQTATTYEYRRPALKFDDVTLTVRPVIEQWTGPARSMVLDAVPAIGMRCPS